MTNTRHDSDFLGALPLPTPEHQRKITKEKWFEVGAVVLFIVAGAGYLAWRDTHAHGAVDPSRTMRESTEAVTTDGAKPVGEVSLLERQFRVFRQDLALFDCNIELIGEGPETPLETAIIWLTPAPGRWTQSPGGMRDAVNAVASMGQKLVGSTGDALEKASRTMTFAAGAPRPHDKGVAGTADGWKVTYVTYRSFDEGAAPEPALYLVLQRLSAGSNPELAAFNRTLYEAIDQGSDADSALRKALSVPANGST